MQVVLLAVIGGLAVASIKEHNLLGFGLCAVAFVAVLVMTFKMAGV